MFNVPPSTRWVLLGWSLWRRQTGGDGSQRCGSGRCRWRSSLRGTVLVGATAELLATTTAPAGRTARKKKKKHWLLAHVDFDVSNTLRQGQQRIDRFIINRWEKYHDRVWKAASSKGQVVQEQSWGESLHFVNTLLHDGFSHMGSGTLCETVVSKHSSFAKDCVLVLLRLHTESKLFVESIQLL